MNDFLRQLQADLGRIWNVLSRTQRMAFIGAGLATVIAIVVLIAWAQSPDYQPLFTNLEDTDAGAVIAELQTSKIPYQISSDGKRISIPGPKIPEARLSLAQKGLPSNSGQMGYPELFDKNQQFGQTDAIQHLNMQRALQGELARTIKTMSGVDNVRVALAIPEQSLFAESDQYNEPSATVMLRLRAGASFGREQATTIVHLVAKSVPNLKEANVIVADTAGHNYSQDLNLGDQGTELSASQMDVKRSFENNLRRNLQGMLDKILGVNGAVVQVQSEFDFNQVETNSELYQPVLQTPDGTRSGLIRSQREAVEAYAGRQQLAGGAPGTAANIPTYQASDSSGPGSGDYRRSEVTRNYEINKQIKRLIKPPAELKRLSVSVVVNGDLPDDQRQGLQQTVSAAAGIDSTRGDTFVLASIPFNDRFAKESAKEIADEDARARLLDTAKILVILGVGVVSLLMLRRALRSREEELFEHLPMSLEKPGVTVSELGAIGEEDRKTHLQREITKVVRSQPQEVARLVRTWMLEDEG